MGSSLFRMLNKHSGNSTDIESEIKMLGVTFGDIHIESLGNMNIDGCLPK